MLSSIIENFSDVIVLMVFFGASIFIHELGHFLVAIKLGLVVDTFSIGFGPAIWKTKKNGIVFKVCWIPLGGYVALPQLDPSGMATVQGVSEDGKEVTHRKLPEISPIRRIAVSAAGAAGNIVLAVVFACIIWLSPGAITYKGAAVIKSVDETTAAYAEGLRAGDEILAVNGTQVATWYNVSMEMLLVGESSDVDLIVLSGKEQKKLTVPIVKRAGDEIPSIAGIVRQSTPCILKEIVSGSSADTAGLLDNDIVKKLDGVEVSGANEFAALLGERIDKDIPIVVERNGEEVSATVVPRYEKVKTKKAFIGIVINNLLCVDIRQGSPASEAGFKQNDIIKSFDGITVKDDYEFIKLVGDRADKSVAVVVERAGKDVELKVVPRLYIKTASIGATPTDLVLPWMQEKNPIAQLRADASGILRILKALVTPKQSKHAAGGLSGPVMIFAALWMAIKISMFNAIGFIRFLNINLAILNMLPIPVLDGGHIMFSLWEMITKRKVHAKVVNILVNVFAVMLIGVFLILTSKDVGRIFPGVKKLFGRGDKTECVTNVVENASVTNAVETATNSVPMVTE
jgi:regulator of sigma E protease